MSELTVPAEALAALPLFPLPGAVLLPQMVMSLHVFEPRYRQMLGDVIDGHRALAVAMLEDGAAPGPDGRPPIHPVVGVGLLRRSARLPDGRYNIVVEGAMRARIAGELPLEKRYRRARAVPLHDVAPSDPRLVEPAVSSLRSLCSRLIAQTGAGESELLERLNEVVEPGLLADLIAAATIESPLDRQRVLAEPDVLARVQLASAALGQVLLSSDAKLSVPPAIGWGIGPGKA